MLKRNLFLIVVAFLVGLLSLGFVVSYYNTSNQIINYSTPKVTLWEIKSIDTMKYSRDLARVMLNNGSFDQVINQQIADIASTGANYVAIATPYDTEFLPFLKRWVKAARDNNLSVWYRGNWSGWEGWFDYPKISQASHVQKTAKFITDNPTLFEDGDIFTPCPECENGGEGDPRFVGKIEDYRGFLIKLQQQSEQSFGKIDKDVKVGYFSMNGDVANLVMDPLTTDSLGNIATIDHYVYSPAVLAADAKALAQKSQGDIILGEFGAPIPDIHGNFTEKQQADWIQSALNNVAPIAEVKGLNYWVNVGGSTQIWTDKGVARQTVGVLTKFYKPQAFYGVVVDEFNNPIINATVENNYRKTVTDSRGYFELPYVVGFTDTAKVSANGYFGKSLSSIVPDQQTNINLTSIKNSFFIYLLKIFKN